ncbi:MAG: alpha/beta hydrolase [Bacteroidetes bacterium]|nr:alpha/beta hydrolase [Bacteroidota bacterium]
MTNPQRLKIPISAEIGEVSALLLLPKNATTLLVLGHGAGANMEHAFMEELSQQLAEHGVGTLRYNFPYMEKGGGPPDRPKVAHPTVVAAVKKGAELAKGRKLLAGGKSFGGRMTSQVAAQGELKEVAGIVYFGFPLHAPGKPGTERAAYLTDIKVPQLFLQGTRDTLAEFALIEQVCQSLKRATLVRMEGGDHSFKTLKSSGITHEAAIKKLASETAHFAAGL